VVKLDDGLDVQGLASVTASGISSRPLFADEHRSLFLGDLRLNDEAAATARAGAPLANELQRGFDAGVARRAANSDRGDHRIFSLDLAFSNAAFRHGTTGEGGKREAGKYPFMRFERRHLYHKDNETPIRVRAFFRIRESAKAATRCP